MLVVLTVALGAVFGALVRAPQRVRIFLAGVLFALTGWALLQYFVLPVLFPLVADKGFTPKWYAVSFGVYGVVLGALVALLPPSRTETAGVPTGPPPGGPPRGGPPPPGGPPPRDPRPATQTQVDEWSERMRQLRERR